MGKAYKGLGSLPGDGKVTLRDLRVLSLRKVTLRERKLSKQS